MFNSNVAPRVRKVLKDTKTWLCLSCSHENRHYHTKCGFCNERRP